MLYIVRFYTLIGFVHDGAVVSHQAGAGSKLDVLALLHMECFHAALKLAGADAQKRNAVAVILVHIGLDFEHKAAELLAAGIHHIAGGGILAAEHFARVTQVDTMKRKQFVKGMEQIAQEGAIQIFRDLGSGMEEVIVGVVGVLQLEVLEYRLRNEYNVDIRMQTLPYEHLRWIMNDPDELDPKTLDLTSDTRCIEDLKGNHLLLFGSPWSINWAEQHNEQLKLSEFGNLTF